MYSLTTQKSLSMWNQWTSHINSQIMNISNNLLEMLAQQTKKKKQQFGTSVTNQIFKKGAPWYWQYYNLWQNNCKLLNINNKYIIL